MSSNIKLKNSFLSGVLAGMAAPVTLYERGSYSKVTGSDIERMRSDVNKIGSDFRVVIEREHGRQPTKTVK